MSDEKPPKSQVAESPIADVFEGRHPAESEKDWAEKTLLPTLEKSPEKPIGAATGINLDEHGTRPLYHHFRRPDPAPVHAGRSSSRLERRKVSWLSRTAAVHARHSRHRLSRQAFHHAPVLRLRLAGRNQPALQVSCWSTAAADFPSLSICPRSWATTPIIRPAKAKSASAASPSIRWRTWKSSSAASIWKRPPSR